MVSIRSARIADAYGIAQVQVDTWRTTYKGIVSDAYLDQLSYQQREQMWQEILRGMTSGVFVAEDEQGHVIGFSSGGLERENNPLYRGELYAIYIQQSFQRSGLGRKLTTAVVQYLLHQDVTSMLVWVIEKNPASRFYQTLGGTPIKKRQETDRDGRVIDEVAYGWQDIYGLL
ncbi:MAG TPA: GNAT family N-acetyltransferase [Dictyobacter sp.]|jgi:GNAT superfamily N-acetyltransferase|nr:GNAT family N-acetyltransferase [Dictyobacter sp.]